MLVALLALTWLSIPLLMMHAGLESHEPRRDALLSARRALTEPAEAQPTATPIVAAPSIVDTSTTSLYHLFSVPILASQEPIPREDLDEVTRIVMAQYHSMEKKLGGSGSGTGARASTHAGERQD